MGKDAPLGRLYPLWKTVLMAAGLWDVALLLGAGLAAVSPILGALGGGALAGIGLGLAWRRLDRGVSRSHFLQLALLWGAAGGLGGTTGVGIIVTAGVAGYFTARLLRRTAPGLTRRQTVRAGLGWSLAWVIGGLLFAIATALSNKPLSGALAAGGLTLIGLLGAWFMFGLVYEARGQAPGRAFSRLMQAIGLLAVVAVVIGLIRVGPNLGRSTPSVPPGMSLHDDFEAPAFDGAFDPQRWKLYQEGVDGAVQVIEQKQGQLSFRLKAPADSQGAFLGLSAARSRPLTETAAMQARLAVAPELTGQEFRLGLNLQRYPDPDNWHYSCWLTRKPDTAQAWCAVSVAGSTLYESKPRSIQAGQAYDLRLEADPKTVTLWAYLNGELLDTYQPTDPTGLRASEFVFGLTVWAEPGSAGSGTADDFWLGKPEAQGTPQTPGETE